MFSRSEPLEIFHRKIKPASQPERETLWRISYLLKKYSNTSNLGTEAVFGKIDFAKASDSVNWLFLKNVMEARGFPLRWIEWIKSLYTRLV